MVLQIRHLLGLNSMSSCQYIPPQVARKKEIGSDRTPCPKATLAKWLVFFGYLRAQDFSILVSLHSLIPAKNASSLYASYSPVIVFPSKSSPGSIANSTQAHLVSSIHSIRPKPTTHGSLFISFPSGTFKSGRTRALCVVQQTSLTKLYPPFALIP